MRSLLTFLLLLLPAAALPAAAAPLDEVKASFRAYKAAILESDGKAAAEVVTQDSRDYFRRLADYALELDRAGLQEIHLSDRLYALLLRHDLDRARLESMSGGEVVAYAVARGWIGREGAEQLQLGNYQVDGDTATGTILRPDGQQTRFQMTFAREDGDWRLELAQLMELTRVAFEYSAQQSGLGEDEFILRLLEYSSGRKPGPDIWEPPA
jgi:hypothetical protein